MMQGIASPRAAHAVAYDECVCTTPPTSGICRYTYACVAVSLDGLYPLALTAGSSTALPSRSQTTIESGVSSG